VSTLYKTVKDTFQYEL